MAMNRAGRKRLVLVLAVVLLGAVVAGGYTLKQAQTTRNMARWLEEGTAAYESGDYPEALGLLSNYVSRDKTNAKVLLDFADTRIRIPLDDGRHISQARGIVQTALALEPDSLRGRTMLMKLYRDAGLWTEARDAAERVLQLDESNLLAHETRLNAFIVTDQSEDIISAATRMASAIPGDLDVQRRAFRALLGADADTQVLDGFLADCESRFAGRLGLELMRAEYLATQILQSVPDSPDAIALNDRLEATMLRASTLPAETTAEARDLIFYLDQLGSLDKKKTTGRKLAQQALERFLETPALSAGLASFAAERNWSRGLFVDAGTVVLTHTPDLDEAESDTLGWLALSGLPEADKAREILRTRQMPDAEVWLALSDARRYILAGDPQAAGKVIPNSLLRDPVLETIARYLRGMVQKERGEIARASQTWRELLIDSPNWSIARRALAEAYLSLNRPLEAHEQLRPDRNTTIRVGAGNDTLYLRVSVAIDENGLSRPQANERNSYDIMLPLVKQYPDDTEILCLAARSAIATGHLTEARQFTDHILQLAPGAASNQVATLAGRLDRPDPERASALRDSLASVATDPATVLLLALSDADAGHPEQGIARLRARLDASQDADKLEWNLALAHYRDSTGDPDAAARLLELSALHPESLRVQQLVLQAESVWEDPASLGPVVLRLREIAGSTSSQWRLSNNKRELALIDRNSDNAEEHATNIMFDLVALTRDEPNNIEALDVFAAAAEIAGDTTRAAEYLLRAVRAEPKNITRRLKLINVALPRAGRVEEARQHAAALADYRIEGNPSLLRERAVTFERFGLMNLARADWERLALTDDPTARIHMAEILAASGSLDEADAHLEAVLAADTIPDRAMSDAANYLARRGDAERGLALLERLPESSDLGPREKIIARYLYITFDTLEQARLLEAKATAEGRPALWAAVAHVYMNLGNSGEARRVTNTGLTLHPGAPELSMLARMFASSDANNPLTLLAFLQARRELDTKPESIRVVTLFDQRLNQHIDNDQLINALHSLVEQSPTSSAAWEALATAYLASERLDGVADTLRTAMEAMPADPGIARFAASHYRNMGAPDQALSAARQWRSRLGRPDFDADRFIAARLIDAKRERESLPYLEPWRTTFINNRIEQPGDAYIYSIALAASGQSAVARDLMAPLADIPGSGLDYCIRLTNYMLDHSEQKQWLQLLMPKVIAKQSQERTAQIAGAWWDWGLADSTKEDTLTSTLAVESLLATAAGQQPTVIWPAALGRYILGDLPEAATHYRNLVALDPSGINAHNNLADLLLQMQTENAEALEHANTAVKLAQTAQISPLDLRSYLDTQAQALLANGRADEAVNLYVRALEPEPSWPTGVLGYAEALAAAGRPEQARETLKALVPSEMTGEQTARAEAIRTSLEN